VSDEGTAQYNVPIQVPPGRADVQPVLSLRYGGTKSSGEAGIGWKIEGLSQITRCPRTYALDGYAAPIMNTHTDRFCLDGKRLEMVTSANAYGGHGTEYRTLIDSFNKVKSWWDPLPIVGQWNNVPLAELAERGPDYFEVWTKDGRKLTYGRTRDSLLAGRNGVRVAWLLNKVEDRSGNNMIVRYNNLRVEVPPQAADKVPNMVEPQAIFYTGHGSMAGDREVRFDYEGRGDFRVIYGQGGVPLLSARRLKRVTTFVKGVAVKNYRLDYESDQVSLIRKIFECAHGDDAQCKPPSEFDYEGEHGFSFGNLSLGGEIGDVGQLDMNGDGLPDFLVVKAHVGPTPDLKLGWKIAFIVVDVGLLVLDHVYPPAGLPAQVGWSLGKGPLRGVLAGSPKVSFTGEVLKGTGNRNHPLDTLHDISGLPCQSGQTVFLDYDQDGKDDIVGSCSPGGVFVARALGDGNFAAMETVESLPVIPVHARERPVPLPWPTLYDVNGDGLQDIVSCFTQSSMQVRLRQGPAQNFGPVIGLGNPDVPDLTNPGHRIRPRLPFCGDAVPTGQIWDVDGDGTPELLVRYRPTRAEAISSHRPSGWYALRYSPATPELRWDRVDLPDTGDSATGRGMQVADLNNDGLADIWRPGDANGNANAPEATVWLNSGNGFLASTVARPLPRLNAQIPIQLSTTLFVDHNADGRLDVLEHWVGGSFGQEFNQVLHPDGTGLNLTASIPTDIEFFNEAEHATFAGRYGAVGDIDADGNADLFGSKNQAYYGSGLRNMSLSKIKDGLGNTVHVYYGNQAYKGTCPEAKRWPAQCVKNLKGLVSGHTEGFEYANDFGGEVVERQYTYGYENGRIDVTGHGWLGFDKRTITEQVLDQIRTVTVEFEPVRRFTPAGAEITGATPPYLYPLAGMPRTTTVDAGLRFGEPQSPLEDAPHSRRTRSTQEWTVQVSAQGRPFPVLSSTETQTFSRRVAVQLGEIVPFDEDGDERTRCWDMNLEVDGYSNVRDNTKFCVAPDDIKVIPPGGIDQCIPCQGGSQGGDNPLVFESLNTKTTYEPDATRWWISNPKNLTITSKRNGASQTQSYFSEYDIDGLLHAVTRDPSGDAQRVVYTRDSQGFGSVERIVEDVSTGEDARVTDVVYDTDRYFPSSITNHVGGVDLTTQIAIEPHFGQVAAVADANGVSVVNTYDGFGTKKQVTGATGKTDFSYASLPFLRVQSPAGRIHPRVEVTVSAQGTSGTFGGRSVVRLDNHGRVVQSTSVGFDGADLISERSFDERGRLAAATSPHLLGAPVVPKATYTYDYLDRVTRVENADGTYSEQQYASGVSLATSHQNWIADLACPSAIKGHCAVDVVLSIGTHQPLPEGAPVQPPGALGAPKQNVGIANYAGLTVRTIDGEHVETATATSNFDYAPFNRLHHLYDNGGAQTSFAYDAYGRMLTHTDPDGGGSTTTYNGFGEVKTTTDANGVLRTFFYDTVGRVTSIQDPDDLISSWIYDVGPSALGRLSETISPPTQENPDGQHVVYSYEPLTQQNRRGFLSSIEYLLDSASYVVGLHYNDLGQPLQIDYPTTSGGTPVIAKYHYQGNSGALESVTENGSGVERAIWHLDDAFQGQMASQVTFGNGAVSTFGYDSARHWLRAIDTTLSGASIQSLEYSHYDDGQVHERITPTRTQEYAYDPLGRLKTLTNFSSGQSSAPHDFDYDAHGNLTQKDTIFSSFQHPETPHLPTLVGGNAYTYHANGNLLSRGGADVPGQLQLFSYTPFDLPREILTGSTTQRRTQFEYTADEDRVVRRDPDTTRYYVGDLYQRVVNSSGSTIEERFRINAGGVVAEIVRGLGQEKTLYLHADHLGTPDTISDGQGNSAHQEYGPFGDLQGTPAFINIFGTHLGFTGHQQDFDLGLTDMHGRVFDPLAARFTTADPIMQAPFFSQGQNRYAYVLNDPINLTDPSGFAFDTSGDVFAQGHIVGDSMTALGIGGVAAGLSYGIGSAIASAGIDMEAVRAGVMPTGPASATATAIGIATLVQDVADLVDPGDHSGESSRIVAAPSAAPRGPKIKPRSAKATAVNKAGPPVPKPRGEWDGLDDGEWRKLKEGPSIGRVANQVMESPAMKGDPNAAEFIDGLLPDAVLAGVPGGAMGEALTAVGRAARLAWIARKAVSLPAWGKITVNWVHIGKYHRWGAPIRAGKATFFPATMNGSGIMRAVRQAWGTAQKVGVQGADRILLRGQGAGLTIEMWFNKATNMIETAYPVFP
jgi:RHS repeat-associated protein